MSGEPRVEWRGRLDFAEVAEALDVPTDQVMSVLAQPGTGDLLVIYNPEPSDDYQRTLLYSVLVRRGQDDVLFAASTPKAQPGLWEQIEADLRRALNDEGDS